MTCRVFYIWRVPSARRAEFLACWAETTDAIHHKVEGARGSLCLENADDPACIVTQAIWDGVEQWRAFIATARTGSMSRLHDIATLEGAYAFDVLEDRTR